ncbi:Prp5p C terminal EIF4a-1-family RNA SFII helicase [Cryptosporidium ubiquitum]|uniref:RNA helicase n=1 Tax=Cryptosporidium ubiquitum TaxID=857276 RepID=A0A1J4MEC5_9CRYT|nr:Prp5p C terminal EIF4a-1-family RNA SFII helicase [Cryptosporidium ubiquitum]OII72569.1 Prp5p C terminal EIF4a-1-family RNA SFII helicase [Cryptosporidium ubiquitum]
MNDLSIEMQDSDLNSIQRNRISKIYSLSELLKTNEFKEKEEVSINSITLEDIQKLNSETVSDQKNDQEGQKEYHLEFIKALKTGNLNNTENTKQYLNPSASQSESKYDFDDKFEFSDQDNDYFEEDDDQNESYSLGHLNPSISKIDELLSLDKKKRIPEIYHDQFNYPPIIKNYYKEVNEIKKLKQHEVDHIRITNNGIHIKKIKNINKTSTDLNQPYSSIKPILNFSQCGLPLPIHHYLKKKDIIKPFPIQMQSIPILMSGYDMIGIAETGSGKTLAYILPLLRHVLVQSNNNYPFNPETNIQINKNANIVRAMIIIPTRELALQVYKQTTQLANLVDLTTNIICGGLSISHQLNKIRSGSDIIIGTPGRIIDIMALLHKKIIIFQFISFLVIDEGDRLFDMGFAPQLLSIISIIRPDRQIAIFSATFPNIIEQFTNKILHNPIQVIVGKKGQMNQNVKQYIELLNNENDQFLRLLQLLGEWAEFGLIVIFCNRQTDVDELFAKLIPFGYNCLTLHSGQDHYDRHSNLTTFSKTNINSNPPPPSGQNILIATSIFSRGLHVDNILLVINFGAPHHIEDYIHRIGRTGRAGNFGTSFTLLLPNEIPQSFDLIELAMKYSNNNTSNRHVTGNLKSNDGNNGNSTIIDSFGDEDSTIIIQPEIIQLYNELIQKNKNTSSISSNTSAKKRIRNFGFGGKGFKFSKNEKSSLQLLKDDTKKALGLIPDTNITEEQIFISSNYDDDANNNNKNSISDFNLPPHSETSQITEAEKALQLAAINAAKLNSTCNIQNPNIISVTDHNNPNSITIPNNLHQVINGRVIGIFEINDYPTHIRQKIVHKDIIKSINDNCGVTCQVKGIYIPPDSSSPSTSSVHISEKKKLYIEINGPNHPKVQKAIHEINLIISSIKQQSNIIKPSFTTGKYTLSNLIKK